MSSRPYGRAADPSPIRLMIVDDSIVARSVFQTILADHPAFRIVATASTARQALARLDQCRVDIVLLDLAMPGMDGLSALPEIIARGRGARVLIVSTSAGAGADACVRALTLGAADTLEKPSATDFRGRFADDLIDKLLRIGGDHRTPDRVDTVPLADPPPLPASPLRPPVEGPVACVAIGSSTGGLHALSELFAALPASCAMPILITQHLPASFMPFFAQQMTAIAGRPAAVARDGMALAGGQILVAPGDAHITLRAIGGSVRIILNRDPAPSACLPSVDPMLTAVARIYGPGAFGIILTGMGRDGAIGARALVEAGGELAAQDRASSVVWGMPGSVATAGLCTTVAHPAQIARRLGERVAAAGRNGRAWR